MRSNTLTLFMGLFIPTYAVAEPGDICEETTTVTIRRPCGAGDPQHKGESKEKTVVVRKGEETITTTVRVTNLGQDSKGPCAGLTGDESADCWADRGTQRGADSTDLGRTMEAAENINIGRQGDTNFPVGAAGGTDVQYNRKPNGEVKARIRTTPKPGERQPSVYGPTGNHVALAQVQTNAILAQNSTGCSRTTCMVIGATGGGLLGLGIGYLAFTDEETETEVDETTGTSTARDVETTDWTKVGILAGVSALAGGAIGYALGNDPPVLIGAAPTQGGAMAGVGGVF